MANITIIAANAGMAKGQYGGAERSLKLAESLTQHNVTVLMSSISNQNRSVTIRPGLKLIEVNEDRATSKAIYQYALANNENNLDVAMYKLADKLTVFRTKFKRHLKFTDLVILDHVGAAALIQGIEISVPMLYASHNCEIDLAKQMYGSNTENINSIQEMERLVLERSDAFTYCSIEDDKKIKSSYGVETTSFYIPNGTDERFDISNRSNTSNDILFIGSGHGPNVEAAKKLLPLAKKLPEYTFHIVGKCGDGIEKSKLPRNVVIHGHVEDKVMDRMFRTFFAFINPMSSGSGTHLKVMRALSYGMPVISSSVGLRGFSPSEINDTMLVANSDDEIIKAIDTLENKNKYREISNNTIKISKPYLWKKIQGDFQDVVNGMLEQTPMTTTVAAVDKKEETVAAKESVLIYSIIRNRVNDMNRYYNQIKLITETFTNIDFYLSIYENDSTDGTKQKIFSHDWSFLKGVSIISEDINTPYFGSVKDAQRVELLSNARNKAVMAGGLIDNCDYVLMIEGDVEFGMKSIDRLLSFKRFEPDFDVVSSVSLRPNGRHYDWWATRTTPIYKPKVSELDPNYAKKEYGPYYSTSNGLCLYKAAPFKEGVRHGWINSATKEFDCEMVVLCQNFRSAGYDKIFIDYKSIAQH